MNGYRISILVIFLSCFGAEASQNSSLKEKAKGQVEEINRALINEDFAKILDLTHPRVAELAGGRDKMISMMESSLKEMKAQGVTFRSSKVYAPREPVKAGSHLYIVVPFLLEPKVPGGKLLRKSYVIGVSNDQGKSWVFVNGNSDVNKLKRILPALPAQLKLPEKQKPVFEKE